MTLPWNALDRNARWTLLALFLAVALCGMHTLRTNGYHAQWIALHCDARGPASLLGHFDVSCRTGDALAAFAQLRRPLDTTLIFVDDAFALAYGAFFSMLCAWVAERHGVGRWHTALVALAWAAVAMAAFDLVENHAVLAAISWNGGAGALWVARGAALAKTALLPPVWFIAPLVCLAAVLRRG